MVDTVLIDDIIATTSMSVISQFIKAIMTVFKCFSPQVRQLRRGLLEEQEREQENRVSIAFLSEIIKKDSEMCCVV